MERQSRVDQLAPATAYQSECRPKGPHETSRARSAVADAIRHRVPERVRPEGPYGALKPAARQVRPISGGG